MAKRIIIDKDLCEGCETCVSLCPEVFALGDDGKVSFRRYNDSSY